MSDELGWHFTVGDMTAYDARPIVVGETLRVSGKIIPCERGLHASPSVLDALGYAPGPMLWRVRLSGEVVPHGDPLDKWAASERTAARDAAWAAAGDAWAKQRERLEALCLAAIEGR